eukprot:921564-Prorocentrum_minimum.AAC.4
MGVLPLKVPFQDGNDTRHNYHWRKLHPGSMDLTLAYATRNEFLKARVLLIFAQGALMSLR